MNALRPCPSCQMAKTVVLGENNGPRYVRCMSCYTTGPLRRKEVYAVAAWNALPRHDWNALPRHDDPPRWIHLSERTPGDGQRVLVWCAEPMLAWWNPRMESGFFTATDGGVVCTEHWMPLPEPPRGGS